MHAQSTEDLLKKNSNNLFKEDALHFGSRKKSHKLRAAISRDGISKCTNGMKSKKKRVLFQISLKKDKNLGWCILEAAITH